MKKLIAVVIMFLGFNLCSNAQLDTTRRNDTSAMRKHDNERNRQKDKMNRKDSAPMDDKMNQKRTKPKSDSIPRP